MMLKLSSIGVLDWFLGELFSDCVYEIERPVVVIGGEGIHDEYHLELNQNSFVREVIASFPSLPLSLKIPCEVPKLYEPTAGLFGM